MSAGKNSLYLRPVAWVVQELSEGIASGKYPAHAMLPSERTLSEELRIGRGSVRLALAEIEKKGLVRRLRGRGMQVLASVARPTAPKIVTVHPWITRSGMAEAVSIYMGITIRLKELGYASDQIHYFGPATAPSRPEPGVKMVPIAEVPGILDAYDGVLFQELADPELSQSAIERERRQRPVIVANMEEYQPVSGTRIDHQKVFREATVTLIGYGHTRIGFVGRHPGRFFYDRALAGYRQALEAVGLSVDEALVRLTGSPRSLPGYAAAKALLRMPNRPTGIVAARDELAEGVCHAAEEAGLRVGYDLSVIGFDNVSWQCEVPMLTTFEEPAYTLGATAAEMLVERLTHGWRPVEQRELDCRLVLRRSVGPPPIGGASLENPAEGKLPQELTAMVERFQPADGRMEIPG
jgi:DNA-binding transcriptional regulator YhcF (GntR family)